MRVDLHTHSIASPDGALTEADYTKMLNGGLDVVAVTDHNTISFAEELHHKLGNNIIIGEEITTLEGEIIGLYLTRAVKAGMSAVATATAIKEQGGLVYIPHPFETVRKGITLETLDAIAGMVDIVETNNGRAIFQNKSKQAAFWAAAHGVPGAASSDSHGRHGWGKTYSVLAGAPSQKTLPSLLMQATHKVGKPGVRGILYPKFNRIRRGRNRA
jgi:predicted metal-dependent phosphoesterase TrpH